MAPKKRDQKDRYQETPSGLTVATSGGEVLEEFPAEVMEAFRLMGNRMTRAEALPGLLAFTSAVPGEGVTFCALGFGATLSAYLGKRVCVAELNWWRPRLAPADSGTAGKGLASVLKDAADWRDALIATDIAGLSFLPAGQLPVEARSVAARGKPLVDLVGEIRQEFDVLIVDAPSVFLTSDAVPLVALAPACCLVVRQGATSGETVRQALDELSHLRLLGVVMNRVRVKTPRWIRELIPQD
jgi:Mrp family chromosome partitioning ATPase